MNKETVLDRIKKIIEDNDLTNSEFAEKIGVPKSSISHLLSKRNKPSLDIITKISEKFDEITSDYLIFGSTLSKKDQIKPSEDLFSSFLKITVKILLKYLIIRLNQSLLSTKTINLSKLINFR
tara:strand:- start:279 stop:647 length:369 start_codon:yes stop_codon:yes gene_type:complete